MADVQHPEAFWTNSPAGRINLQDSGTSPKALIDRGAVEIDRSAVVEPEESWSGTASRTGCYFNQTVD